MKVLFMGTPEFSVPVLQALHDAGHEIVGVYTQPPRPAGRGKRDRPSPVHQRALDLGLPVHHPTKLKPEADAIKALGADVGVVVAYGLILPQAVLDAPTHGCLNIHASLLPRWRGAAPIHRAIMAQDTETGICIMQMEAGLDTGPVLLREATAIGPEETTGGLHDRLSVMGARLITQTLERLHDLTPELQSEDGVTYAEKIVKAEARIDWTLTAAEVDAQIRGLSPFPGAWFNLSGARIKVLGSRLGAGTGPAGTALDDELTIACGSGAVQLTRLQKAGKGPVDAAQFLNGNSVSAGTRL
ncbi:MAG: methionyl-tRNA formyltransferase [Pseudomonadota bacterium]